MQSTAYTPEARIKSGACAPCAKVIVRSADLGQTVTAFGDRTTFLFTGEETQGKFTCCVTETPPGGGPPPHFHLNEDELFHVLEGRVGFLADGQWTEVDAGAMVYAPRGAIHTFRNVGTTPSRLFVRTSPSGFETFLRRCAEECQRPGGPDMERIVQIAAQHGIHFVPVPGDKPIGSGPNDSAPNKT